MSRQLHDARQAEARARQALQRAEQALSDHIPPRGDCSADPKCQGSRVKIESVDVTVSPPLGPNAIGKPHRCARGKEFEAAVAERAQEALERGSELLRLEAYESLVGAGFSPDDAARMVATWWTRRTEG